MPPFLTGRRAVVAPFVLLAFAFFFLVSPSSDHFPSPPALTLQKRNTTQPSEVVIFVTITSGVIRAQTLFTTDSVTVTLKPSTSSSPASSSSIPPSTSSSPTSTLAPSPFSSNATSSSISSSRATSSEKVRTLTSVASTSPSPLTLIPIPKPATLETLDLVPTTLSVPTPTPSTFLSSTSNVISPTTLLVNDPATSTDQALPSSPAVPVQASSSGSNFWSNKGAVGGTFTVVSLLVIGILVFLVATFRKRQRRKRTQKLDEEFFGNLFQPDHSRASSVFDTSSARSLTGPAMDPFAAREVVQIQSGGTQPLATGGISNGPSAFKNYGYTDSDDGHGSNNSHSSSNHHGFSNVSYHTGVPNSRGNFSQPEPPLFYQPPSVSAQPRPYNDPSNFIALPPSMSTMPSTYTNPAGGPGTYYTGQPQPQPYYQETSATDPPGGFYGHAF